MLEVSSRRMERLVESLGVTGFSKSQVSAMAAELDEAVEAFRTHPWIPARTRSRLLTPWCSMSAGRPGRRVRTIIAPGQRRELPRDLIQVSSAEDRQAQRRWPQ